MEMTRFDSMEAFADAVLEILEQNEVANNLMIHNISRFASDQLGFYALITDDEAPLLALQQVPGLPLLLSALPLEPEPEALENAVDYVLTQPLPPLNAVVSEANLAAYFAKGYAWQHDVMPQLHMEMGLYSLSAVRMPRQSPPGVFFMCRPTDIDLLTHWGERFRENIEGVHLPLPLFRAALTEQVMANNVFFWMNGEPVSMACRARATRNCAIINSVFTPPEHRGNGYATACVAALTRYLLVSGYDWCGLYTDMSDMKSNRLYQSLGYKRLAVHAEWRFGM